MTLGIWKVEARDEVNTFKRLYPVVTRMLDETRMSNASVMEIKGSSR